jgi:putative nucleotidyltransferase with HDIG domain
MFVPRTLMESEDRPGRGALVRAVSVGGLLALILFGILTVNIATAGVSLDEGDVAQADISADQDLSFVSDSQTKAKQDEAAAAVQDVYVQIAPQADIQDRQLRVYDSVVRRITGVLERRDAGTVAPEDVAAQLDELIPELSDAQVAQLAPMVMARWEKIAEAGRTVLEATLSEEVREDRLSDVRQQVRTNITNDLAQADRELAGDLAAAQVAPNVAYSAAETEAAKQAARDGVDPLVVTVRKGQTIVSAGQPITVLQLEALRQLGLTSPRLEASELIGSALVATLIASLLVGFLWRFEPMIWFRNRSLLLFMVALIGTAIAIRIASDRTLWAYVVPTAGTVLLTAILLDGAAGAAMAVALAVLAGVMNGQSLGVAVYTLAGGLVALTAIVRAERLNAFLRAGGLLAVTNIAVLTGFILLGQRDLAGLLQGIAAGVVNAGLAVVLAVGSFAVIGNLFGIMTVFQLLELANPSSRLLRRLLLETPGTYHHSVMVGNLAERAAETIGADALLVRVGAYYHDIGKMKNPLAFIENQAGSRNIHDDLTAEVSARIIASHIRDGIDLGYEYGLPVQIIGFIPQHHGTSVMSYFYGKALREAGGDEEAVKKDLFRYPGPKPQSREAAILMLSDGVEASVRSLDDKDEASIRAMVDRIVDARVEDGQLDDAELTLKNITQIKEAFVQQLLGMYHSRIKYPDNVVPLEPSRREQA